MSYESIIFGNDEKKVIEAYIKRKSLPAEGEEQLNLTFQLNKKTLTIFELRSPNASTEESTSLQRPIAQASFVMARKVWKIYWPDANGYWGVYDPIKEVKTLSEFFKVVDEDEYDCFWGIKG